MLYELPIANIRLLACHEAWHRITPAARGRHCQRCNREALRLIRRMPAWTPHRQGRHAVSVRYTLPVRFELTESK